MYLFRKDRLCEMLQATDAVYPQSRLQRCIAHQNRSSTRYVSHKDIKHWHTRCRNWDMVLSRSEIMFVGRAG